MNEPKHDEYVAAEIQTEACDPHVAAV
jgi:hypothetical protein